MAISYIFECIQNVCNIRISQFYQCFKSSYFHVVFFFTSMINIKMNPIYLYSYVTIKGIQGLENLNFIHLITIFRITSNLIYKLYIIPLVLCISFIQFCQVVFKQWPCQVFKSNKGTAISSVDTFPCFHMVYLCQI